MKKISLLLLIIVSFLSCSKDTTKPPSIDISNLPKAYVRYFAPDHLIYYRNYKYDSNHNLAGISIRQNDTSGGSVYVDSGTYYFNVDQSVNLPTGYTFIFRNSSFATTQTETHALYFNNQKQVTKDSGLTVISGNGSVPVTKYFTYTGNTVARNSWHHAGSAYTNFLIDSVFTDGGDVKHYAQYAYDGSGWTVSKQYWVGIYSSYANPFYNQGLSYSFGGFLLMEGIEDFLSKDLANDAGFTFVTDSKGRVVSGTASDGSYFQVTYQ